MTPFARRRHELMKKIGPDAIALIFPTGASQNRAMSYRQGSTLYYLSGFTEADTVIVLAPHRAEGEFLLFCPPSDPVKEQWEGKRAGVEGAVQDFGADQAHPIEMLSQALPTLLQGRKRLYHTFGGSESADTLVLTAIKALRGRSRTGLYPPTEIIDVERLTDEMRLIKSPEELQLMQKAADITAEAHIAAMRYTRPERYEYEIEAIFWEKYRKNGAIPAYTSIVAGGKNSTILHYTENNQRLKAGDLLLIDAGAEFNYYAADITRTFPINGRFTAEQRALYEVVLAAQEAAIEAITPQLPFNEVHLRAVEVLTQGLVDLGILLGDVAGLMEQGMEAAQRKAGQPPLPFSRQGYFPFYMHQTSHWLGLDVHDVGAYKVEQAWRPLEENMVLTVEPGLYIPERSEIPERWHAIGIRIEDDVCVSTEGAHVLTSRAPKQVAEIETLMSEQI